MSWIEQVLDDVKDAESPEAFKRWACLFAISSILKKNVHLRKQNIYRLYPNTYVMLVAKSGQRKGFPVMMAKRLIAEVGNIRLISGQNSIQAVVTKLKTAFTLPNGGPPLMDAHASLISGEFHNLIIEDPSALPILTELYNTHENEPNWTKNLKGQSGEEVLKNPCLSLLGGTNEAMFNDIVGERDVKGGFVARTIMVLAKERGRSNALVEESDLPEIDWKKHALWLKEIATLSGRFFWDEPARLHYKSWYEDEWSIKTFDDPTGTTERVHDTILKTTMAVALSKRKELKIYEDDFLEARDMVLPLIANAKQITIGSGKSSMALQTKLVVEELLTKDGYCRTRPQLLSKFHQHMTSADLDIVIQTLSDAGIIENVRRKGVWNYTLTPKFLKQYAKGVEEDDS